MLEFRLIYYVILVAYRSRAHSISTENKRTLVVITSVQGDSKLRRSRGESWGERRGQNWENVIDLYFLLLFKLTLNCGCRESIYRRCNCLEKDKKLSYSQLWNTYCELLPPNPCKKLWSSRLSAPARNVGSQCWLSILDRWLIKAWMIIAGLYWLDILTPKSFPIIGRELLPELSRRPFKFIMILIMPMKLKT